MTTRNNWKNQYDTHAQICDKTPDVLRAFSKNNKKYPDFLHQMWTSEQDPIEKGITPKIGLNFLDVVPIATKMYVSNIGTSWFEKQHDFLSEKLGDKIDYLLKGELIGAGTGFGGKDHIVWDGVWTNGNNVHNLYHLIEYEEVSGNKLSDVNSIIEWGAGFGNLARLVRLYAGKKTYIAIDTPVVLTVQWVYLACIFGLDSVNIVNEDNPEIKDGCFNFVSWRDIDLLQDFSPDMFISTWALSESTLEAQRHVADKLNFFNADHLILGLYRGPEGYFSCTLDDENIIFASSHKRGAKFKEITYFPDYGSHNKHFYIFQ